METKGRNVTGIVMNICTAAGILACILLVAYGWKSGIFSSKESMEAFIGGFGIWGPVVFVLIQIVQVIIPILPGGISCVAGVVLFGPVMGFVYNYIGICIGSLCAFLISKRYGSRFVRSIVSPKTYERYVGWLEKGKKFDKFFALAIFFPVAPDDLLCYLAGLTRMTVKKFTAIIVLGKPASTMLYSIGLVSVMQLIPAFQGLV